MVNPNYQPPRTDPLQSFRFLVKMGGEGEVSAAFSRFSGIQMEMETLQIRSGNDSRGVKEYVPVFTSYAPVTLSRGVVGDNEILNWMFSASAGEFTGPSDSDLRRTIDVVALDDKGRERATWTLLGAMPIGYQLSPMDGSRSEVLTENITFAITGVKRKYDANPPAPQPSPEKPPYNPSSISEIESYTDPDTGETYYVQILG